MSRRTRTQDPQLRGLLACAAEADLAERLAAAKKFELAARWAEAHPAPVEDSPVDELGELVMFGDQPINLAGEGAPGMSEFAVAEFAAAVGMTAHQGRAYLGAALEAKYRLPQIWARAMAGEVAVWKVRRVTDRTRRLDPIAAASVDRDLAPVLESCSWVKVENAVETAAAEADPEHAEGIRLDRSQSQHLDIGLTVTHLNDGLVPISGLLDYTDALALEAQIKAGAHALLTDHPELDLDIRRAMAAGQLGGDAAVPREVVIYAHHQPDEAHGIVTVEGAHLPYATIEQLHEWCATNGTKVSVRPVLDLSEEISTDAYAPTARQREQAILTTPTCVFPHCNKDARDCDLDHIQPYARGGKTTSSNLAPLCRYHHRVKTFGGWTYRRTSRTGFLWTTPKGRTHPVDVDDHRRRRTR
ncbi:HNH endonuclease signature motif containing protein [Nocardioides hankookensis]|uniref:HNH endonuclease signature motif containing protein n=1 Tax=Nocardioides hankookensis TaxID=443157 RepID=A0ABW1LEP9_9ACTN